MLRLLVWAMVVVLAFFAYQTHTEPQVRHNSLTHRLLHPIDVRVRYRVGDVDERFGLSHDDVKRLTHEAVMIWHDGTGGEWFVYDDEARLTINLIYDERQIETLARQKITQNLNDMQHRHQVRADALQNSREALQHQFDALQRELQHWQDRYANVVSRLAHATNEQARHELIQQHNALIDEQRSLNAKIHAYEFAQSQFNQSVDDFNIQVNSINQAIDHANERLTPRHFHKGVFSHGAVATTINIYEFANIDELRLTLAHELGHALYLDHNDDPTALMYPYAQKQELTNFKLKQADIDLLNNR